jgi:uncharacterized repeat protein (TIGR01451 family)
MTRHWNLVTSGLVVGILLAGTTLAQTNVPPSAAVDGASGLRPGWSREAIDPATRRAQYVVSPAATHVADSSTKSSRSFLPNWFNWGGDKQGQQRMQKRSSNNSGQTGGENSASNSPRPPAANANATSPSRPQSNSLPPDPAAMQEADLPGLRGAPLPRKASQSTGASATTGATRLNPNATQSAVSANTGGLRTASREPLMTPGDSPATGGNSVTRNSPGRRTTQHITPDELRRELSGAFPAPTANKSAGDDQLAPNPVDAIVSDAPQTLPAAGAPNEHSVTKDARPQAIESPPSALPLSESAGRKQESTFGAAQQSKSAFGTNSAVRMPFSNVSPPAPQIVRGKEVFGEALQIASGGDPNVLASNQTPVLTSDIRGPKQIMVGREAVYRIRLQNQSDIPAEGIVATVRIPSSAEVLNTNPTQGLVQPSQDGPARGQLQWQLARLDRRANETLEIRLVPRESRPLELGVSWTIAPVGSKAVVEVQEAKLQLEITGPNEVLFDTPQVFKLTLSNPGTGPAESVKIDLMPPGGGSEAVTSHPIGDLAPGATQTVEVELTGREAGKLFVKAAASAEGGLVCDAAKEIFCRKPELEVDWRGPAMKYAGTMATYFVRVRNPGTAATEEVTVRATLPEGAEFTSASEGQIYDAASREVAWHVGTLSPGDDNYMEIKCILKSPGANRMRMSASTASGNLVDNKTAETNVIAIADLKLEVIDPSGPVAVGTQATYEIHVHNRGASAAKDINVVALFSEGIEPEQAEGATYTVSDGRVSFRTIEELAAGRDIVLRVRAHAVQPGMHVFRAEVLCRDLEIKLAAEETTRFYAEDTPNDGEQSQKQASSRSEAFEQAVK